MKEWPLSYGSECSLMTRGWVLHEDTVSALWWQWVLMMTKWVLCDDRVLCDDDSVSVLWLQRDCTYDGRQSECSLKARVNALWWQQSEFSVPIVTALWWQSSLFSKMTKSQLIWHKRVNALWWLSSLKTMSALWWQGECCMRTVGALWWQSGYFVLTTLWVLCCYRVTSLWWQSEYSLMT